MLYTALCDSVRHSILLHKLSCIGAFFLVDLNLYALDSLPITHGVPQGAILSPLLFCIYMNDLPSITQSCNFDSYVEQTKRVWWVFFKDKSIGSVRISWFVQTRRNLVFPGLIGNWFSQHNHVEVWLQVLSCLFQLVDLKRQKNFKDLGVIFDTI